MSLLPAAFPAVRAGGPVWKHSYRCTAGTFKGPRAADPGRFMPVGRAKVLSGTCWTMPTIARGLLYCRSYEGQLVCLEVAAGPKRPERARK